MRRLIPIALLLFAAAPAARARDKVHVWTDAEGVVHVDDTPGANGSPLSSASSFRKSKGSPLGRAVRWWERATDAPPDVIDHAAELYKIPAELIRAVIAVESAGDTTATSRVGAQGLMQLMPGTAGKMYVEDPVDPAQNIQGGARYLRTLANEFDGDMVLVLAAYNAGPDAVRKYHGVPPFEETRGYVRKVMAHYNELRRANAESGAKQKAPKDAPPPVPALTRVASGGSTP